MDVTDLLERLRAIVLTRTLEGWAYDVGLGVGVCLVMLGVIVVLHSYRRGT